MSLMYFLRLSTISCYVRYLSGDLVVKNKLHGELQLRSGPAWFPRSLSTAGVQSTVFFLYCLVCLYKIFTLKLRMLQIYPLVAHVIFHENPVKFSFFASEKILSSLVWLSSSFHLKVSDHLGQFSIVHFRCEGSAFCGIRAVIYQ